MTDPEVTPEDLKKYEKTALRLVNDLVPGETIRWADAVNTAASMGDLEEDQT